IDGIRGLALWLGLFIGLFAVALAFFVLPKRPRKADRALTAYREFCRKMAKAGVGRKPSEGPCDFALRAQAYVPASAGEIEDITALFCRIRYESRAEKEDFDRLEKMVGSFRVRLAKA
ncbi:MAG: DUF4129 domain-containing protein, partial [Gammaproteobacteria bacterium]